MEPETSKVMEPSDPAVQATAPTVYFIDDSATMREVIKLAFRRENINVITCADAASALAQFEQQAPDAVISDVIMPDKDGYEVCQYVKQHATFGAIPVILMSGLVDRGVAEKALSARADELIRKPFQPQDLIARVKKLLKKSDPEPAPPTFSSEQTLTSIFGATAPEITASNAPPQPKLARAAAPFLPWAAESPGCPAAPPTPGPVPNAEKKLRAEIARLEILLRKLQSQLETERQYAKSLEEHIRTLQEPG